jgi:hypothetical protein
MPFMVLKGATGEAGRAMAVVFMHILEIYTLVTTLEVHSKLTVGVRFGNLEVSMQFVMWETFIIR